MMGPFRATELEKAGRPEVVVHCRRREEDEVGISIRSRGRVATAAPMGNPLVPVVRELSPQARRAMYAAANSGRLRRRTWNGCPFNRAGSEMGAEVTTATQAATALATSRSVVRRFIAVWDRLPGADPECTQLLREALEEVGLFEERPTHRDETGKHAAASSGGPLAVDGQPDVGEELVPVP
jgi:hypothetical protein